MAARSYGQYCGLASALDLVGERWALLIVRDLLVGPRRYTDLKRGLPRIPTNILSARLRELQEGGVVRRVPLPRCGLVYELTPYGRALEPVVLGLSRWGFLALGDPEPDEVLTADSMTIAFRAAFVPAVAGELPPTTYEVHVGPVSLSLRVDGDALTIRSIGDGRTDPADLVLVGGPAIRHLLAGTVAAKDAVDSGLVEVRAGRPGLLARFVATFNIADPTGQQRSADRA